MPGLILLPAELSYPPGNAGRLRRKRLESFSDSQAWTERPGDIQPPHGGGWGALCSQSLFLTPCPFSHHHLSGLHGNPAGPTSSGEMGLDHHSPITQLISSHRATQVGQCPLLHLQSPRGLQLRWEFQKGVSRGEATLWSRRGSVWLPRERRLSFKKWWDKGTDVTSQQPGCCTVFIFKTTKVQELLCTFLHFFFLLGFWCLFLSVLSWFANGVYSVVISTDSGLLSFTRFGRGKGEVRGFSCPAPVHPTSGPRPSA